MNRSPIEMTINEDAFGDTGASPAAVATAEDYLALSVILITVLHELPLEGISTIVPMLIAIDRDAGQILIQTPGATNHSFLAERRRACKEVVCCAWKEIAAHYSIYELSNTIEQASPDVDLSEQDD